MKNTQTNGGSFAAAKLQAKRCSLLAIIVIAAVIGFAMTACDDSGPVAKSITITGIPGHDGDEAMVYLSKDENYVAVGGPEEISDGSVTVPLKKFDDNTKDWTGSDSCYVVLQIDSDNYIYVVNGMPETLGFNSATTTVAWGQFDSYP